MPANETKRPRTAILVGLLAVLALGAAYMWWPAAGRPRPPSTPGREQRPAAGSTTPTPPQLGGRLEVLHPAPPQPGGDDRTPFRFYVKPPPPPPPAPPPAKAL